MLPNFGRHYHVLKGPAATGHKVGVVRVRVSHVVAPIVQLLPCDGPKIHVMDGLVKIVHDDDDVGWKNY